MPYNFRRHHRRSICLKGWNYAASGRYAVTICLHQRECLLGEIKHGEMQLNRYGQIDQAHWRNLLIHHPHLQLDVFVIMPNHIHGILVLTEPSHPQAKHHGIAEIVRGFKTFTARRINQIRRTRGVPVWQRNYYESIIRDDRRLNILRE